MGIQVVQGAVMACSFGAAPASLLVTSQVQSMCGGMLEATIMDFAPIANIPPFGMCSSLANPQVASATAAALGVLTPMPCVPATTGPWAPGSPTHQVGNFLALNETSKCMCAYGGVISITFPGQVQKQVP